MGVKEDNLGVGTEATLEISTGVRHSSTSLAASRRVNEVGFEIVNMDLESRYRLRRLIMDALEQNRDAKVAEVGRIREARPILDTK